jgi:manganese-dependent inorganic pyrophosphatase
MNADKKRPVYVVGHKNPDTDSICSAIAYANLKNILSNGAQNYIAGRAGAMNPETEFVLKKFKIDSPQYIAHVMTQVRDMEIRETDGVPGSMSLKRAWEMMRDLGVVTLPVTEDNKLKGLITISDIATAYMDVYDNKMLSTAASSYKNILDTLDGEMIVGDEEGYFDSGEVVIATANPDVLEDYIHPGDMVVLGNRYESQLCAIEMNAAVLLVSMDSKVSITIKKLAEERGCRVISTPYDTFTVARLLNQSMPISYFMKSENLITFDIKDRTEDIKDIMGKKRHRDFPVLDKEGNYIGMISRRNLINAKKKQLILVDHNEESQAVDGIEDADILEIIDHHRLGSLETLGPVFFRNEPVGCTATILERMYRENNVEITKPIAGLLCSAIISDTLMFRSPTCTSIDRGTAERLAAIAEINIEEHAKEMFSAGSDLKDKTADEIFYQDFKKFAVSDTTFGVGQINSMNDEELLEIKNKLIPYMENAEIGVDAIFFMLTDIMNESTEMLFFGKRAKQMIEEAFLVRTEDIKDEHSCILRNVVSRKKQVVPAIVGSLQH